MTNSEFGMRRGNAEGGKKLKKFIINMNSKKEINIKHINLVFGGYDGIY